MTLIEWFTDKKLLFIIYETISAPKEGAKGGERKWWQALRIVLDGLEREIIAENSHFQSYLSIMTIHNFLLSLIRTSLAFTCTHTWTYLHMSLLLLLTLRDDYRSSWSSPCNGIALRVKATCVINDTELWWCVHKCVCVYMFCEDIRLSNSVFGTLLSYVVVLNFFIFTTIRFALFTEQDNLSYHVFHFIANTMIP